MGLRKSVFMWFRVAYVSSMLLTSEEVDTQSIIKNPTVGWETTSSVRTSAVADP